ncbi:ThuA domain-containing protein [Puniceicoccaceae bacterium K14]|nr:ThuA domain-containing protein [Puniceicoccaceae bacterium K14]
MESAKKILFLGDNHYKSFGSKALAQCLEDELDLTYVEDSYGQFLEEEDLSKFDVFMISAIGDTPGSPHASEKAGERLKERLKAGASLMLFHGGSAAFWRWEWWRKIVGLRWVRPNDPVGVAASTHPVVPYALECVASEHPLSEVLQRMDTPRDELYIELEQTTDIYPLMESSYDGKTYVMAYESQADWGGKILGYLPGHDVEVASHSITVANVKAMLEYC